MTIQMSRTLLAIFVCCLFTFSIVDTSVFARTAEKQARNDAKKAAKAEKKAAKKKRQEDKKNAAAVKSVLSIAPWSPISNAITDIWDAAKEKVKEWASGSTSSYCGSCGSMKLNSHSCTDYYYDGSSGY